MAQNNQKIGWIGMGRMGFSMRSGWSRPATTFRSGTDEIEGRAAGQERRQDRRQAVGPCGVDVLFSIVSAGPTSMSLFRQSGVVTRAATSCRRFSSTAPPSRSRNRSRCAPSQGARQRFHLRAGERQRQGDQIRQALLRRLRAGGGLSRGRAMIKASRRAACPMWRGRARARVQDRAQRHARRRDREPDRDHAAHNKMGVRATPSCVPQQRRDGLDVTAYKSPRWSISTGPRPSRPSFCARISIRVGARARDGRADAGDGGDARGAAGPFRRRHAAEEPGGIPAEGFCALMETWRSPPA